MHVLDGYEQQFKQNKHHPGNQSNTSAFTKLADVVSSNPHPFSQQQQATISLASKYPKKKHR
jgi:hypothetical protein